MNLSPRPKASKKAEKVEEEFNEDAVDTSDDMEDEDEQEPDEDSVGNSQTQKPAVELKVPLSQALIAKLKKSAEEEGILVTELAAELITEGLVLRVWEILERNQNIRGGSHPNNSNNNNNNHNNHNNRPNNQRNFNNNNRHHRNNNRNQNNMNIMQDKAAFLEYVRNQERKRR